MNFRNGRHKSLCFLQIFSTGVNFSWNAKRPVIWQRQRRLVSVRLQLVRRNRRQDSVAAVRAIRRCTQREGDARLLDAEVQGIWICDDEQLRGGTGRNHLPEWIPAGQSRTAGELL